MEKSSASGTGIEKKVFLFWGSKKKISQDRWLMDGITEQYFKSMTWVNGVINIIKNFDDNELIIMYKNFDKKIQYR